MSNQEDRTGSQPREAMDASDAIPSSSGSQESTSSSLYEKLDTSRSEIRLLKLIAKDEEAPLDLTLVKVALDDQPEFWALSYVWGDASIRKEINVNGHTVSITSNLFSALRRIQDGLESPNQSEVLLWADAICINQRDLSERSEQVQLMRSIYQQASLTVAWLGLGTKNELLGMVALSILSSQIEAAKENGDADDVSWLEDLPDLSRRDYDPQEVPDSSTGNYLWDGIEELLKNSYWKRTWTLQEVVLSENLVLMCGSLAISEIDLVLFLDWIQAIHARPPSRPEGVDFWLWIWISTAGFLSNKDVNISMRLRKHSIQGLKFLHKHAVLFTRKLQATDPRDKVYGVLGIADTDSSVVDYSNSTKQVYSKFAEKWITEDNKLNILSYAGVGLLPQHENPYDLPSWTPDWQSISRHGIKFFELYDAPALSATGHDEELDLKYHYTIQEGVLRAHGIFFDDICNTEQLLDTKDLPLFCSKFTRQQTSANNAYAAGMPPLQAIFRVLLADKADPERGRTAIVPGTDSFLGFTTAFINLLVPAPGVHDPAEWEKIAAETLSGLLGIETDHRFAKSFQEQFFGTEVLCPQSWHGLSVSEVLAIEEPAKKQFYSSQLQLLIVSARDRLIFRTRKGYFGLGPPGMLITDSISMVFGCKYPIVLRQRDSHFILVGVCFVLGFMGGEALKGADNSSIKEIEIY